MCAARGCGVIHSGHGTHYLGMNCIIVEVERVFLLSYDKAVAVILASYELLMLTAGMENIPTI